MKEFMSYLIIIAIMALIGFICYMIVKRSNGSTGPIFNFPKPSVPGGDPVAAPAAPHIPVAVVDDEAGEETGIFTEWAVVQLDRATGVPIKKKNIKVSEKAVFTIGRNKSCDFVLEGATPEDYASRKHLGVGRDEKGYFAKPFPRPDNSKALTYIEGQLIVDSFDLVDRQVILLGKIPIAFVRNEDLRKDLKFNPGTDKRDQESFERDYENTMAFSRNSGAQNNGSNGFTR